MQTSQNKPNTQGLIEQNPVHVDSKWFKEIIALTGSMEEAMLLSDTMIYYRNRYKAFKVGDQYRYGLIYSAKDYQKNLHIPYRKAMDLPKKLVEKGFLEAHGKKFMCNRTFYTPTKKALENIYKIHFSFADNCANNKQNSHKKTESRISIKTNIKTPISASIPVGSCVKPLLRIRTTACADSHNPYKDKHKDKKNNSHNNRKNDHLLENSKDQNVETVIFDFKQFHLGNMQCEKYILDYFTVKQSEIINTVVYCYHNTLDIIIFNQILNRSDLKKEAANFKQLVTWAYLEATKENKTVVIENQAENQVKSESYPVIETQNVNEIVIDSSSEPIAANQDVLVDTQTKKHPATILPEITVDDIHAMIEQRQKEPTKSLNSDTEIPSMASEVIASECVNDTGIAAAESQPTTPPQSAYLLNPSNKLYLLETLSEKGINDAVLILKTAEEIISEYPGISFNDLLDGVVYRLVKLPEKKRQQALINQTSPMEIDRETGDVVTAVNVQEVIESKTDENDSKTEPCLPDRTLSASVTSESKNMIYNRESQEKTTQKASEINQKTSLDCLGDSASTETNIGIKNTTNIIILKQKTVEKINEIRERKWPDVLNKTNQKRLTECLDGAGFEDEEQVLDAAKKILIEYPDIGFNEVIDGVIYRLIKLPEKQKKQGKIHPSLAAMFSDIDNIKPLKTVESVAINQPTSSKVCHAPTPQLSDLTMPQVTAYVLRQDWATKAEQDFYTGLLPESQKLALVAMIDYVKRKGVTITLEQEVYEWLYHMASNKDYYYSRAKNFKHWCNIVMRQLMQRRLHKPTGFARWKSIVENHSLSRAA